MSEPAESKDVLAELVALLTLERIEENLFRGQSQDLGWGAVFGGQVLGQALSAATQTVPSDRMVHSMQAYFLRPGAVDRPIVYDVDRSRDGASFTTRRVVAIQNGKPIFHLSASFQLDEPGFEHQAPMPLNVPPPDGLQNEMQLLQKHLKRIPEVFHSRILAERPIELRPVDPTDLFRPEPKAPHHAVWVKAAGKLSDDQALHRYLLAYASDFGFMTTSMRPHGLSWVDPTLQTASIDHVMWFHRDVRVDEWLLHVIDSPNAHGSRGFVRGSFFDQAGRLVASTAQEGLVRRRK